MKKKNFDALEHKLENGIELITIKKSTEISSVQIGIKVGAIDELEEERGICHFIEHMLFKGTKKRDNNRINQDLEERAGSYDAYTDYTSTVLSITSLWEELEKSIEILGDILINSNFPNKEINKERGVILSEYKTSLDDIEDYSFTKVHNLAFEKSPLKYDVIGCENTIKALKKDNIEKFYQKYFIPNNMVISIVSPLDHDDMKKIVEKYFGAWIDRDYSKREIIIEKNKALEKISYRDNVEQSTIVFLYTFHGLSRKEELALDILSHKLGESPNSILFRELREERGLAYDVYSEMDTTEGIKTFYIYTSVSDQDIDAVKEIIKDCISKIKAREIMITERDIEIMKKVIKTSIAMILEDSEGLASYALNQKLMNKKIDTCYSDLIKLNGIEVKDIYDIANKVLEGPTIHLLTSRDI